MDETSASGVRLHAIIGGSGPLLFERLSWSVQVAIQSSRLNAVEVVSSRRHYFRTPVTRWACWNESSCLHIAVYRNTHPPPYNPPVTAVGARMVLPQSRRKTQGNTLADKKLGQSDTANSYHGTTSFPDRYCSESRLKPAPRTLAFFEFPDCGSGRCYTHRKRLTNLTLLEIKTTPGVCMRAIVRRSSPPALRRWRCCCRTASRRSVRTFVLQQQATAVDWPPRTQQE